MKNKRFGKISAYSFANFDDSFLTAQMLLEVGMRFPSSVVIFCEWNLWIILQNHQSVISSELKMRKVVIQARSARRGQKCLSAQINGVQEEAYDPSPSA